MMKPHLSVVLATHNEAANLARCLHSVEKIADEIIIADGESTDDTLKIARKFHAKIIATTNKPNFHINKNMAIDAAKGEWILQMDADEALTEELLQEIRTVMDKNENINGYWVPRLNYFIGRFLTKGGQYPDYTLRLYRRGKGRLPGLSVHEQAEVVGEVGFLKHDLLHYGTPDFENYLLRFNRYTSLTASEFARKAVGINTFTAFRFLLWKPVYTFCNIYLRHKGIVDGFPGFVFALFSGLHFTVAYIKYWQMTKYPA